ncbi:Hypothetical protein ORPV_791 [Orpheovirus IHUMI-LCC2]|uniref:Uncharacterized protein n=1 Tax=Orpheovirus IHUMI-LCC2 TaxID=2023057 RepID=A0A2I2L563_9VIRU|nr:Hypothetical protein ORPV_791 [Orpheovirus IHUMI-LCC2]SNW62695.1 Hypothetical protein ORPV_791 [Orpheovirus IHUMI-LCC2]
MNIVNIRDELHSINVNELREYTNTYLGNTLFLYRNSDNIYVYTSTPSSRLPYTIYDLDGNIIKNDNEISRTLLDSNALYLRSYFINNGELMEHDPYINLLIPEVTYDKYFFLPTSEVDNVLLQYFKYKYNNILETSDTIEYYCFQGKRRITGFDQLMDKLLDTDKPFVATLITLNNPSPCNRKSWDLHVNLLFINKKSKEIIRFEPRGWGSKYDAVLLDTYIESNIPNDYTYIPNFQYCPRNSFQKIQAKEKTYISGDPPGFCASWSIWFLEYTLANPDISQSYLLKYALQNLPKPWTTFMRNYSTELTYNIFQYLFNIRYFDDKDFLSSNNLRNIYPLQLGIIIIDDEMIPAVIKINPNNDDIRVVTNNQVFKYTSKSFPNNSIKII